MVHFFPKKKLITWFLEHRRPLPWREKTVDPYAVWVSEVMLQQTQVKVVIPYFERWMARYPTIRDLAAAPVEDVVKLWEGLGYYSRARNLHAGACAIVEQFGGIIPRDADSLSRIKGLGPYTIGAIRSFAFREKSAAVDGNVIRVLTRFFDIGDDISSGKTLASLRDIAFSILPETDHWHFNEGLIELGATVCKKSPECSVCPLQKECLGHQRGTQFLLPHKSQKIAYEALHRGVAVVQCGDHLLIRKGVEGEIMNGLHEFPYFEFSSPEIPSEQVSLRFHEASGIPLTLHKNLKPVQHSFTRYRVHLAPYHFITTQRGDIKDFFWHPFKEIATLPFSSGHRRVLEQIIGARKR